MIGANHKVRASKEVFQPQLAFLLTILIPMITFASCTDAEQAQLQTAAAEAGQTAAAEGQEFLETQAAQLQKTVEAGIATQVAHAATELARMTPSPWDTSWVPSNMQFVVSQINTILKGTGLAEYGSDIMQNSQEYGVNPAFALAMFRKEANFATPNTRAYNNRNPGNIIATGNCRGLPADSSCNGNYGEISTDGRFGVYASMSDGIKAYFMLLNNEYKSGTNRNCSNIPCIINVYCPPSDCDTPIYIIQITDWTRQYQNEILSP